MLLLQARNQRVLQGGDRIWYQAELLLGGGMTSPYHKFGNNRSISKYIHKKYAYS